MQRVNSLQGSWQIQGVFPLVTLLVAVPDQLAKLWVSGNLSLGQSWPEEGVLRLTYVQNTGVAFGLLVYQILPLIFSALVIIAAFFLYRRFSLFNTGLARIALGLIVGGSIGNLVDRVRLGYVIDFIDLKLWGNFHWPAFNIADTAIVIGAILIAYVLLRAKTPQLRS